MVFLIDGSKSVRPENFELVKKWINQIVEKLDVSERNTHVGLVQYSSSVKLEFPLGKYSTKNAIKEAVKKMAYMERGTMTGQALGYLVDKSFSIGQGARPMAAKVGIIFTDGRSQDYIGDAAKKAKDSGNHTRHSYYFSVIQELKEHLVICIGLYFRLQDVCCWSWKRS